MAKKAKNKWWELKDKMYALTGTEPSKPNKSTLTTLSGTGSMSYGNWNLAAQLVDKQLREQSVLDQLATKSYTNNNMMASSYQYQSIDPFGNSINPQDHRIVLFYGFNGMLGMKYSWCEGMSQEEVQARMQIAGDKIPYKIMFGTEFNPILNSFIGTPNSLKEISFEDAMTTIRMGIQQDTEEFEDAETDQFDDNCLDTCRPGNHKCGK